VKAEPKLSERERTALVEVAREKLRDRPKRVVKRFRKKAVG
jgi:hypothetical protein